MKKIKGTISKMRIVGVILVFAIALTNISAFAFLSEKAGIDIICNNKGNIFFNQEIPEFEVAVKSFSAKKRDLTLVYNVSEYNYDGSMNSVAESTKTMNFTAGESKKVLFTQELDKYGIYKLSVSVKDANGNILGQAETEFSKVIENSLQNDKHGICVHLVRAGNVNTELMLAKKAGFSMVRDDFTWSEYESEKGKGKLNSRHKEFLNKAREYGFEVLAIVGGSNGLYDPVTGLGIPHDLDGFSNFVRSLLSEKEFDVVKRIEIQNEPQATYVYENGSKYYGQDYPEIHAPYYARQMISASAIIEELRPDIEIGGLSLCLMSQKKTDTYINEVFDYINENNNGKIPFDALTIHPYNSRDGKSVGDTVGHYIDVAANKGYDETAEVWCTEYGKTSGNNSMPEQFDQAKYIIKAYADMKSKRFEDDVYLYELAQNSGTYGLVSNVNSKIPYSAKASYIAVSALNNLTGDAKACTKTDDEFAQAYSFTNEKATVNMFFPKGREKSEYGTDFIYYDIFGNEIDINTVEQYCWSQIPFYEVKGKTIETKEKDYFVVSGQINSRDVNKTVSLTVLENGVDFDEDMLYNIKYADQSKTGAEGNFEFKFDIDDKLNDFVGYVVSEDSEKPIEFQLKGRLKALRLYSGATEINSFNLDLLDLCDVSVTIDFSKVEESSSYNLVCAFFKDNRLTFTKICEKDGDLATYDISVNEDFEYDSVRLFLFDSINTCTPLCSATIID